jgi:hypothetical protein
MIEAACRECEGDSRMEFYVADCSKPLNVGQFDIIFAFWFLDYAANAGEQVEMWRNVFANLKPGGRCIGLQQILTCSSIHFRKVTNSVWSGKF